MQHVSVVQRLLQSNLTNSITSTTIILTNKSTFRTNNENSISNKNNCKSNSEQGKMASVRCCCVISKIYETDIGFLGGFYFFLKHNHYSPPSSSPCSPHPVLTQSLQPTSGRRQSSIYKQIQLAVGLSITHMSPLLALPGL